jgi:single-strand DNA-binding protein
LHKGSNVYLEGKINYRQYQDHDGVTKHVTEIIADQIILLHKKSKEISSDPLADADLLPPF